MDATIEALETAYGRGDHRRARELARAMLAQDSSSERARRVLAETDVDWFLAVIAALGLGLTAWLVYNYWL